MRTMFAAMLVVAFAAPVHAGSDSLPPSRAPKAELERPAPDTKPVDGTSLCRYVSPDQNAPSERADCVADREPMPQHPIEKSPPGGPGNDATPSSR